MGWVPACERIWGCHVPGGDRRGRCWAVACALACGVYVKTFVLMWACVSPLLQRCLLSVYTRPVSVSTSWSNRMCVLFSFTGLVAPTGLRLCSNSAILWPVGAAIGQKIYGNGVDAHSRDQCLSLISVCRVVITL
jgi:hypothetical protein